MIPFQSLEFLWVYMREWLLSLDEPVKLCCWGSGRSRRPLQIFLNQFQSTLAQLSETPVFQQLKLCPFLIQYLAKFDESWLSEIKSVLKPIFRKYLTNSLCWWCSGWAVIFSMRKNYKNYNWTRAGYLHKFCIIIRKLTLV